MRRILWALLPSLLFLCNCGGGGNSNTPVTLPIAVSLSPSVKTSIDQAQTVAYTATVSNDSGSKGVTWTASGTGCTGSGCGTFTSVTATSATYNAPASVAASTTITVVATSAADTTKSSSASVTVMPAPAITTASLADGVVGTAYSVALQGTGGVGSSAWSLASGSLPQGLTMNGSGSISGMPASAGTSTFTVKVTDASGAAAGPMAVTKQLSLRIGDALAITTASLPNSVANAAYSATLLSTGGLGNITWSVSTGTLPAGILLNASTGALSGAPTAAGTTSVTFTATDSGAPQQSKNQALSITVYPVLGITTASLPNGVANATYSATLQDTGGGGAVTWSVTSGTLPAGILLDASTGALSGAPTAAGTTGVTFTATDSGNPQQTKDQALSITVYSLLAITTASLPDGTANATYSATLQDTGGSGAVTWSVTPGSLPAGLLLNASTGALSGTPTTAGTSSVTFTATDSGTPQQMKSQALSITVNPALAVTTTSLPDGAAGVSYNQNLAATGGTSPYTWSVVSGGLPAGLTLSGASITGAPTASGTFNLTVKVTDSASITAQQALSITVSSAMTSGTVAHGTAVSGATVILKDSAGNSVSTTTAGDGTYSLDTTGFVPPYLVQVGLPNSGGNLYSVSADNGMSTTINVHPFTDLLVRSFYASQGTTVDNAFGSQVPPTPPNPATVQVLQNQVTGVAQLWLNRAGVNSNQNMISGTFIANGTGLDQVLDWTTANPSNLTVTITDGITSQSSTVTASNSTVTVTSTTTDPNGTTSNTSSTALPTATGQQSALDGITATLNAFSNTINSRGSQVTLADISPYLASDFMNEGLTAAQYAAQLAAGLSGGFGGPMETIKSLDTTNGRADLVFGSQEVLFEFVNGNWLIAGNGRIAWINLLSSAVTNQGASYGPSGPELNLAVTAPQGVVSGVTISGGSIWPTATALTQGPTIQSVGVNLDQFHAGSGVLAPANIPAVGTPFYVTVTPVSGPSVMYTIPSNAFTTEQIYITSPTNTSMAGANLGQPLQVSWTLPTTYVITQLSISTNAFTGDLSDPSTQECMGGNPSLALDATSTSVTFPTTCNGQTVTAAGMTVMVAGSHGETSSAVLGFGNTSGGGGGGPLGVTTNSLSGATVGSFYSANLAATGGSGAYTWSISSGTFPSCLTFSPSGSIAGTPDGSCLAGSPYSFGVTVTDSTNATASAPLSIAISTSTLRVTTTTLPGGSIGNSYNGSLGATGGVAPYTWSISAGQFPSCLSLNSGTGAITGTPNGSCVGQFSFTAMVTDHTTPTAQTATQLLNLTITSPFNITTSSLPSAVSGSPYNANIQTSGGTPQVNWSWNPGNGSSLPAGLGLMGGSGTSGTISGTPEQPGSYTFTVTANDAQQLSAMQSFTLVVTAGTLQIGNNNLPTGFLTQSYNQSMQSSGGTPPITWSWAASNGSSLPTGLNLDSSTGAITGTPTATGTFNVTVTATDSAMPTAQTTQQSYNITVAASSCGTGNEALLSGQYAFSLGGYNQNGFVGWVGSFAVDGQGHFTDGKVDTNSGATGALSDTIDTTASSYSLGSDNRGCATIVTPTGGTLTTRFVVGSVAGSVATSGSIMEFDTPNSASSYIASGEIQLQTTTDFTGGLSGNYVVGLNGWDSGQSTAIAAEGVMNASGGQMTNIELDQNSGGQASHIPVGNVTGTYGTFDTTYGRATMALTTPNGTVTAVLYMVSASKLFYLQTTTSPIEIGKVLQQSAPQNGFDNTAMSGNMVMYGNGASGSSEDTFMGLVSSAGSGTMNISIYQDSGGSNFNNGTGWQQLASAGTLTCSYSVASNGRMTVSPGDSQCDGAPVFYLTAANSALLIGQGSSVDFGAVEPQASITFNSSTLSGTYFLGGLGVTSQSQQTEIDSATLASGVGTAINDTNSTTYQGIDNIGSISITVNADGTVTSTENGVPIVKMIIINNTRFVMVNNITDVYPYLVIGQQ